MLDTPVTPFFSNDLPGLLKVVATFGTMLAVIIGLVVKLTQSAYVEKLREQQIQIDGLGERVNRDEANCTRLNEAMRQLELVVERHTQNHTQTSGTLGELRATLHEQGKQNEDLHRDITQTIMETGARVGENVTSVRLDVARLQEQNRVTEALTALTRAVEKQTNINGRQGI